MGELEDFIHKELAKGRHAVSVVDTLVDAGHAREDVHDVVMQAHRQYRMRKVVFVGVLSMVVFLVLILFLMTSPSDSSSSSSFTGSENVSEEISIASFSNVNESAFYVNVRESGVTPSVYTVDFASPVTFVVRNHFDEPLRVVIPELKRNVVVEPEERQNITVFTSDLGVFAVEYVVDDQVVGVGMLNISLPGNGSWYEPTLRRYAVEVSEGGIRPRNLVVGFMDDVELRFVSVDGSSHELTSGFGLNITVSSTPVDFGFKANDVGFERIRDGSGSIVGTIHVMSPQYRSN